MSKRSELLTQADRLRGEVDANLRMNILKTALASAARQALDYSEYAEVLGDKKPEVITEAIDFVNTCLAGLKKNRVAFERREKFRTRFERILAKRDLPEDERRALRLGFDACRNLYELKKWFVAFEDNGSAEKHKKSHRGLLESLQRKGVDPEPASSMPVQGDRRVANLEADARVVRKKDAILAYQAGCNSKNRHDKIRFFKSALRIENHL